MNALTGRKTLARTSNTPGRTRLLNFFRLARHLLLVDLPGAPDQALSSYREALQRSGFETRRPRDPQLRHALHARRGDEQAVLTFFARDDATRLEIFFLGITSG